MATEQRLWHTLDLKEAFAALDSSPRGLKMDDANVNQVPAVMGDRLVGMLTREQVLHYIRVRAELV
ncbi:MAG: hypothetical protein H5T68_13100 [Chloroflexi bacterium]|nr:hypothetical protein [Chloroflexota bacterium]